MPTLPRKLSIAAALVACVSAIALGAAAWWIQRSDPVELAGSLAQRVEAMTGRSLRIDGPVELRLLPALRIVAAEVAFANAPWGTVPDMLRAARIEAEVSWLALLRGEIRISRLVLDQVDAILETDARGNGNWVMTPADGPPPGRKAEAAGEATPLLPGIGAVRIEHARLRWRNGMTRHERSLEVARLAIARAAPGSDRLELHGKVDGEAFQLAGTVPDAAAIRARGRGAPVDLVLSTGGARLALRGRFSFDRDGPLDLRMDAAVERWTALSRIYGTTLALPAPAGLEFHVRGRASAIAIDPLVLRLGTDALRGSASWQAGSGSGSGSGTGNPSRPRVAFELAGDAMDLSTLAPSAPVQAARDRRLFPETPLPFPLLARADVEGAIRIARLRLRGGLELAPLALKVEAKRGIASLQAGEMRIADGRAALRLEIDATAARPAVRLTASGSDLSMERLAAAHGSMRVTGGNTTFTLDYSGSGSSLRALAASASGELRVATGPARIGAGGLDFGGDLLLRLLTAINPFHESDRTTELQCAAVRLPARAGVITVDRSIAYETRRTNVVAAGRIDLRDETLDLVIRPTIKEGLGVGAGQFAQLVRVTGPMRAPGLALDASGALRAAASVGGAVATAGLSLIGEALLNRRTSDPSPCRTALSGGRGNASGAGSTGARADDAGAGASANPGRRVLDGARRLLNLGR